MLRRKFAALGLLALLAFGAVACSSDDAGEETEEAASEAEEAASEAEEAASEAASEVES